MIDSLTIGYITARPRPEIGWFLHSLARQWGDNPPPRVICVDALHGKRPLDCAVDLHIPPKPTIYQGKHRITSEDWWAVSNARNTALCHANSEWILWVDDRCVLLPTCVDAIRDAMAAKYACFGTYEKRHFMEVEDGMVMAPGVVTGKDHRLADYERLRNGAVAMPSFPSWAFGCLVLCPVEWALQVGGFEEALDSLSAEDTCYGAMLANNGHEMRFDPRLACIQDRTPQFLGTPMRREDKGISPNDKSHRAIELFHTARNTSNRHLLLQSRQAVLAGRPFPPLFGAREDWWDGTSINGEYMKR